MISFRDLCAKFLAYCKLHQAPRTLEYYDNYIKLYLVHLNGEADNPAEQMKPFHVEEWIDSHHKDWGNNYKRGGVIAINRVFNWGTKAGYLNHNPIKTAHKPPAEPRKIYMKPEDYERILGMIDDKDPFKDLLMFVWTVGCRPQEVRCIEHRHIHLEEGYIIFPKEESKGKRDPRKIILNAPAAEILKRQMATNPEGIVFRNTRGQPWNKYSIGNRFYRMSKVIGKRMFCYAARHGYGTRKVKQGHNLLAIAATMGHKDGSMLGKVYSHIDEDIEHLKTVVDD